MLLPFIKLLLHFHLFILNKHGGTSRKLKQVEGGSCHENNVLVSGVPMSNMLCIGCLIVLSTVNEVVMSYVKLEIIHSEFEVCERWRSIKFKVIVINDAEKNGNCNFSSSSSSKYYPTIIFLTTV
jgi:hypothetical protein